MAEFVFAEGGTTEVKFDKVVNTQDLVLWVPLDEPARRTSCTFRRLKSSKSRDYAGNVTLLA